MQMNLHGVNCWHDGKFTIQDVSVDISSCDTGVSAVSAGHCFLFPGFVDVHVHLREPGFLYKEYPRRSRNGRVQLLYGFKL